MVKKFFSAITMWFLCCGFFHQPLKAQENNPLINNSGEIISKSIQLQTDTDYVEAIKQLRTVPANDTNYYQAMGTPQARAGFWERLTVSIALASTTCDNSHRQTVKRPDPKSVSM